MVIVKLSGGLGNQLFQYAAGRELSMQLQTPLVFDANYYLYVRNRRYILDTFQTVGRKTFPFEVFIRKIQGNLRVFKETKHYAFDKTIEKLDGHIYLDGWWQNPKYFTKNWSQIQKELKFKNQQKIVLPKNSVSIHVRRGDYTIVSGFGLCSPKYYRQAIQKIEKLVKNPAYFVFSDDIEWVRENLPFIPSPHYVTGQTEIEDLSIMTCCSHHIIANSTFSWWGSTLAKDKKGITIAPEPWVDHIDNATKALYKEDWIILKRNNYDKEKNKSKK